MDIPKVKRLYDIVGDLALGLVLGRPSIIEFPYLVLLVRGDDYLNGVVIVLTDDFEGAVDDMDEHDSEMRPEVVDPMARLTVVKLRYVDELVDWTDTLPLVPVG